MAFSDLTTAWTGTTAAGFYSTALLQGNTKSKLRLFANVKDKIKVPSAALTSVLQAADCNFNDQGTLSLDDKTLSVCDFKINLKQCVKDFETMYLSEQLRAGVNNDQAMPPSVEEWTINRIMEQVSADLEQYIWKGDTGATTYNLCDGLLKQFLADAAVKDVANTTLSATNIFAELDKVYNAAPAQIALAVDGSGNMAMEFFIGAKGVKFLKQAQAAVATANGSYYSNDKELTYLGYKINYAPGMPDNEIVACIPSNLWMATDLESDFSAINIIPQWNIDGTPTVKIVGGFKFGVGYGVGEEIVYYN